LRRPVHSVPRVSSGATALKAIDKTFWLRLAEDWLKLAQEADKPSKRR
jgi:hypothetical protein